MTIKKNSSNSPVIPMVSVSNISMKNNYTGNWGYVFPEAASRISPCEAACPLAVPVSSIIKEIGSGRMKKAAALARWENPLPSICGRVCPHPCESSCSRKDFDEAIAIHALERISGDEPSPGPHRIRKAAGKKIAVIGGGPSGIAAAYYLLLLGHRVTIFDAGRKIGGILRYGIPEYRLPEKILDSSLKDLLALKPEIIPGQSLGKDFTFGDLKKYQYIFLGTGAGNSIKPEGISGDNSLVRPGKEVLAMTGREIAGTFGDNVIIIGGGNTAIDTARSLLRAGKKPLILYRRELDDMPAFRNEVEDAIEEGVEIITGSIAREIITKKGKITGVTCVRVSPGNSGKKRKGILSELKGSEFSLRADDVISAIGEAAGIPWGEDFIAHDSSGIITDRFGRTSMAGIFAGGDILPHPRLVVNALASGKKAAIFMDAHINRLNLDEVFDKTSICSGGHSFMRYLDLIKKPADTRGIQAQASCAEIKINHAYYRRGVRKAGHKLNPEARKTNFKEIKSGLDNESAVSEAMRCFQCGKCTLCRNCILFCPDYSITKQKDGTGIVIDYDHCKGCGICAEECPGGFIRMDMEGDR